MILTPGEIKYRRLRLGLSQDQLAAKVGLDRQTIYLWEAGRIKIKAWLALVFDHLDQLEQLKCPIRNQPTAKLSGNATSIDALSSVKPLSVTL